jgi:hypothetical protein
MHNRRIVIGNQAFSQGPDVADSWLVCDISVHLN